MRIMVKFSIPVEAGNSALRSGKLDKVFQQLLADLKPEAGYFFPSGGDRSGFFVVNMQEPSQIAETVERFFFGLNAKVDMVPVMNGEDLHKALSGIKGIIERYG
ncbi:MAG TPA: hypothetical protein VN802_09455 [Stellaceae bacterium]|nr:hypothetical protein [Stellaceae bacterium]